jgi:hypothetical protein
MSERHLRQISRFTQPTDVSEYVLKLYAHPNTEGCIFVSGSDDFRKEREALALPFSKSPFVLREEAEPEPIEVTIYSMTWSKNFS